MRPRVKVRKFLLFFRILPQSAKGSENAQVLCELFSQCSQNAQSSGPKAIARRIALLRFTKCYC